MTCTHLRPAVLVVLAVGIITTGVAYAQEGSGEGLPFGLGRIFGGSERFTPPAGQSQGGTAPQLAQAPGAETVNRLERLEGQIRQLTGAIEQLEHRNQQLESQVKRYQEDTEFRLQEIKGGPRTTPAPTRPAANPAPTVPPSGPNPGRRGDAFDPTTNPNAPGVPRVIGSNAPLHAGDSEEPQVGAPGGRNAGAPLDLSTLAANAANEPVPAGGNPPEPAPAPAPRNSRPGSSPQTAALPPSDAPKDHYDLAYGYLLRKDYALAEDGFRNFLKQFPSDRMASDAQYWVGESLFQRQRFRDAAEAFLNVSTKYDGAGKAPDALLRLGQSLAALGEKEAACASLGEVLRKYPRASVSVRQGVDREQKRVHC